MSTCTIKVVKKIVEAFNEVRNNSEGVLTGDTKTPVAVKDKNYRTRVEGAYRYINKAEKLFNDEQKYIDTLDRLEQVTGVIFDAEKLLSKGNAVLDTESESILGGKFTYGLNPFTRNLIDFNKLPVSVKNMADMGAEVITELANEWKSSFVSEKGKDTRNDIVIGKEIGWLAQSNPAYALLFNSEGIEGKDYTVDNIADNMNKSVLLAITLGSLEGLNDSIGEMVRNKDVRLNTMDSLSVEMLDRTMEGGILVNFFAENVGKSIVNMLGIKANKTTPREEYQKLVHGFGAIGMQMLGNDKFGILHPFNNKAAIEALTSVKDDRNDPNNKKDKIDAVAKADPTFMSIVAEDGESYLHRYAVLRPEVRGSSALFESLKGVIGVIEAITGEPKTYKTPLTKKPKEANVKIRRGKYANPSKSQQSMINTLKTTEYKFNEGSDVLGGMLGMFGDQVKDVVLTRMGFSPINDKMSKDKYTATKSKNDAVMSSWNFYTNLAKKTGKKGLFYNWFISTNDRTSIDSNTVNPQAEKEWVRWINTPAEAEYEVDMDKLNKVFEGKYDTVEDFVANVDDDSAAFIYAMAQAFGGAKIMLEGEEFTVYDPEKASTNDMIQSVAKLFKIKDTKQLNEIVFNGDSGHIGQQLVANVALTQLLEGEKKVSTSLLFESDGKTNGMAHKAMQMPIGTNMWDHLRRTGIRVAGDGFIEGKHGNLADIIHTEGNPKDKKEADSYQTIGGSEHDLLKKMVEGKDLDGPMTILKTLVSNGMIMQLSEKELSSALSEVTGDIRNYAKTSALEGMYGAALTTLVKNKVKEATDKFINVIAEEGFNDSGEWTSPFGMSQEDVLSFLNTTMYMETVYKDGGTSSVDYTGADEESTPYKDPDTGERRQFRNVQEFIDLARNNSSLSSAMWGANHNISESFRYLLSSPIMDTMNDFLGEQIKVADSVHGMMGSLFLLMKQVYDIEVANMGAIDPSEEQIELIIDKIMPVVPSVRRASSVFDDERIILVKEGSAQGETPNIVKGVYDLKEAKNSNTEAKGIKGQVRNLIVNVFKRDWKEPGASPLPVITHHLDNDNMATAIEESMDLGMAAFLSIFDAVTIGGNNWGVVKQLNKAFIEGNLEYNYMQELQDSVTDAMKYVKENYPDNYEEMIDNTRTERDLKKAVPGDEGKVPTLKTRHNQVTNFNRKIQQNRVDIFKNDLFVMQFSGAKGSYYKFSREENIEKYKGSYIKAIDELSEVEGFDSDVMKTTIEAAKDISNLEIAMLNANHIIDSIKSYDTRTESEFREDYYDSALLLKKSMGALTVLLGKGTNESIVGYKNPEVYVSSIEDARSKLKDGLKNKVNDIIKSKLKEALEGTDIEVKSRLSGVIEQVLEACK